MTARPGAGLGVERSRRPPSPPVARRRSTGRLPVVEPVNPFGGGELDLVCVAPRTPGFDQLGLVEAVDRLGEGVVVARSHRAYARLNPSLGETLSDGDRGVLTTPICVVDNIFHVPARSLTSPYRMLDRVEHQRGRHRSAGAPADDPARVSVDHERHVDPARPGRHIRHVGHPQPVRCRRRELALHQILRPLSGRIGDRGAFDPAADRAP